jgi:hypothetical protein
MLQLLQLQEQLLFLNQLPAIQIPGHLQEQFVNKMMLHDGKNKVQETKSWIIYFIFSESCFGGK